MINKMPAHTIHAQKIMNNERTHAYAHMHAWLDPQLAAVVHKIHRIRGAPDWLSSSSS